MKIALASLFILILLVRAAVGQSFSGGLGAGSFDGSMSGTGFGGPINIPANQGKIDEEPAKPFKISAVGTRLAKSYETLTRANTLYDALAQVYFVDKKGEVVAPTFVLLPERKISKVVEDNLYLFRGNDNWTPKVDFRRRSSRGQRSYVSNFSEQPTIFVQTSEGRQYADNEMFPEIVAIDDGTRKYTTTIVREGVPVEVTKTIRVYRQTVPEREIAEKYTIMSKDKFVEMLKAGSMFPMSLPITQSCPTRVLVNRGGSSTRETCPRCGGTGKLEGYEHWEVVW